MSLILIPQETINSAREQQTSAPRNTREASPSSPLPIFFISLTLCAGIIAAVLGVM